MTGRNGRDPLLPRAVVIGIAVVVSAIWAVTVIAALFFNPEQSGALVTVSSLMAMVLGAAFGIGGNLLKKAPPGGNDKDNSGSDTP